MKKYFVCCIVMLGIGFLGGRYVAQYLERERVQYDLPITTKVITQDVNTYGAYLAGFLAQQHQQYDASIKFFEQALQKNPESDKLKVMVYLLKSVRGEIAEVIPLANDLMKLKQPELLADYVLIADAIKKNDFQKAEQLLNKKPEYGSDTLLTPLLKGWIAVGENNKKKAYQSLKPIEKTQNAFYYYYQALVALAFQDDQVAQTAFEKMSALSEKGYPSLTAVLFLRDFYQKKGLWKSGQRDYDRLEKALHEVSALQHIIQTMKAPQITPQLGVALSFYDISVALAPLKLQETCLILNELALYLTPDAVIPKIWGSELLESAGNYAAANRMYQKIADENDLIQIKIAMNFIAENNFQEARPLLEKLVQKNKEDALLWFVLGDTYSQLKELDKALDSYQQAEKLWHQQHKILEEAQVLMSSAYVYEKKGDKAKVEEVLKKSLALNPNDPQVLNYLGYVWLERNYNVEEAFKMVQKAMDLVPEDANVMDSVALGYFLKKEYVKALELAEKATDQLPFSSVAYQHLGDIYEALGRKREAVYQYQRALTLKEDLTPELQKKLEQKLFALTGDKK